MNNKIKEYFFVGVGVVTVVCFCIFDSLGITFSKDSNSSPIIPRLNAGISYTTQEELSKDIEYKCEPNYYFKNIYNVVIKPTPNNNGFKSYMDSKYITSKNSAQYKLKSQYQLSNIGVYTINGRYCIAMGSYYTHNIGTKIDLVMYNGNVVECILADCKADIHTDKHNRQNPNGSMVEFVVCTKYLSQEVKDSGDLSYSNDESLQGEIAYVVIYE